MRRLSVAIAFAFLVGSANAQTLFRADLDGSQEVPPVVTNAGGYAKFTLNPDDTLSYDVRNWLVSGTAAHIHLGAVGVSGPIVFPLSGGPNVWTGTTTPLTATDKSNLRTLQFYVNVHSFANPGGEIRGQIAAAPISYGAHITGDQEVPPSGSAAVGDATFIVNSDKTITYSVTTTGITGTAAHIHTGAFGVSGGILFGLAGGPSSWAGTTPAMSAADFNKLQNGGLYVNVHSAAFSAGEIRGQIVPTETRYGIGCMSSAGVPLLHADGSAMRGGTIKLSLDGGLPSGSGLLILSLSDGLGTSGLCPYVLGAPLVILPIGLDGTGAFAAKGAIPDLAGSIDLYAQFFGFETGGPSGNIYASNGLLLEFFDY